MKIYFCAQMNECNFFHSWTNEKPTETSMQPWLTEYTCTFSKVQNLRFETCKDMLMRECLLTRMLVFHALLSTHVWVPQPCACFPYIEQIYFVSFFPNYCNLELNNSHARSLCKCSLSSPMKDSLAIQQVTSLYFESALLLVTFKLELTINHATEMMLCLPLAYFVDFSARLCCDESAVGTISDHYRNFKWNMTQIKILKNFVSNHKYVVTCFIKLWLCVENFARVCWEH